jgi:hypothetical protein
MSIDSGGLPNQVAMKRPRPLSRTFLFFYCKQRKYNAVRQLRLIRRFFGRALFGSGAAAVVRCGAVGSSGG